MRSNREASGYGARPLAWAALSLGVWLASLFALLPLVANIQIGDLRWDIAAWLMTTGAVGMAAAYGIGSRLLRLPLLITPMAVIVPAIGVVLAIGVELALEDWARVHVGADYYDPDFIGWTAGLPQSLVLTAIAAFGTLVAPRGAMHAPMACLGLAMLLVSFIVVTNLPGLGDGIEPGSWPLAILIGLAAVYAVACFALAAQKIRVQDQR